MRMFDYQLVYIVGAGHSGSTLLDFVIGNHTKAISLGEINNYDQVVKGDKICTCGQTVSKCSQWSRIIEKTTNIPDFRSDIRAKSKNGFAKFIHQLVAFLLLKLPFRFPKSLAGVIGKAMAEEAKNSKFVLDELHQLTGARYLIDSSKSPVRMLFLYWLMGDQMKILYLTRDGRAVSGSKTKRTKAIHLPVKVKAKQWLIANEYAQAALRYVSSKDYLHVRYEALCRNADDTLVEITSFLEMDSPISTKNFLEGKEVHTFAGNPMRFKGEFTIREDTKWRSRYTEQDWKDFEFVGGQTNRKILGSYFED